MNIAYYVSSHGFGHISRSYEIIKFLLGKKEVDRIYLNTKRGAFIKEKHENLIIREVSTDVGIIQLSSISLDIEQTLGGIYEFEKTKSQLLEEEISFLEKEKIDLIISDASSFPFVFADKLKIPSYCISNFTWDFIYENFSKDHSYFQSYVDSLRKEYSLCKLGLVLPFHCPMDSISKKVNVGIVGRNSSKANKNEIRSSLGFLDKNRYFLFSFGAYGISEELDFSKLKSTDWIVVSGYAGLKGDKVIDIKNRDYPDIVKASDYVLTKPGYGILSETYLVDTPVIYTDRGDFAEYPYLVQALNMYHYSAYISQKELLALDLENAIYKIKTQRNSKNIPDIKDGKEEIFFQIFNSFSLFHFSLETVC